MSAAIRPWISSGVALVGAGVIAMTPVAPLPAAPLPTFQISAVHLPAVQLPRVELTASIADLLTFPALRQFILNRINDLVTLGVGLAQSGAALQQSIAQIPQTLVTVTQQVLSGDLLGALTTIETALVGSIVAVVEPTLNAIIQRRQRSLAVSSALQVAVPTAFFQFVGGLGAGLDEVTRAVITAGQDLVQAVLSLNLGNIVDAVVNGTGLVLGSFVTGAQHVIDGTAAAQQTIATAFAADPPAAMASTLSAAVASPNAATAPDLGHRFATLSVADPKGADNSSVRGSTALPVQPQPGSIAVQKTQNTTTADTKSTDNKRTETTASSTGTSNARPDTKPGTPGRKAGGSAKPVHAGN